MGRVARGVVALVLLAGCARPSYPVSGLRPISPPADHPATFTTVDSLSPTIKWEAFPRPQDLSRDARLSRVTGVTYDLRLWRVGDEHYFTWAYPAELVYSRDGLSAAEHRLEVPLDPRKEYVWTVRAAFTLDGRPRVTQWGMLAPPGFGPRGAVGVSSPHYYQLKAPSG